MVKDSPKNNEQTKTKKDGFFKWLFEKWYFWIISLGWGYWSGIEELRARYFSEFFGTVIVSILIVMGIFGIVYAIQRSISKKVKEEFSKELEHGVTE